MVANHNKNMLTGKVGIARAGTTLAIYFMPAVFRTYVWNFLRLIKPGTQMENVLCLDKSVSGGQII